MAQDTNNGAKVASPDIKKKKKRRIALLTVLVIALVAGGTILYKTIANIEASRVLKVSGNIEGNEVKISFRVAGLIKELLVDEGYLIKSGDVLARLDKEPLERQRDEAAASLKLAEAQYALDNIDYVRAENLYKEGAISAQQRDAAKTKADTDTAEIEKLKASLALAELNLAWGELTSPLNGYITVKSSLQGENVQIGGPIFTAIDLNDIWVSAYVDELDLGKIKLNQKATVRIDAYPKKKYDGRISFISQQTEFTPKYIQTQKERVKYVYRIKVQVDNSSLDLKPGLPADAYIMID